MSKNISDGVNLKYLTLFRGEISAKAQTFSVYAIFAKSYNSS